MKFFVILLISALAFAMAIAFPTSDNTIADLSDAELHVDPISETGTGTDATSSETAKIREPRWFMKRGYYSRPQVIVQPVIVQPQPYYGAGRGFGYSSAYGYNTGGGYW